jgi:NADPH2 dehydrogenase
MSTPNLLKPFKLSRDLQLQHRVVMAPMTRFRADDKHVPADYSVEYYDQRTRVPGTFIVTEGTEISVESGGYTNAPGIYTEEQQNAWAKVSLAHPN